MPSPNNIMPGAQITTTAQMTQMTISQQAGPAQGGVVPMGAVNMLLEKMEQMQQNMDRMATSNIELKEYIRELDSWVEQRFNTLDRRCQKVEVLSERLHNVLRSVEFHDIAAVPNEVAKALDNHLTSNLSSIAPGNASSLLASMI